MSHHDEACEAEWIDVAYSYSGCGCRDRPLTLAAPDPPFCPFAGTTCNSGCPDVEHRACVDGEI